jgi:hypothetical protein
MTLLPAGQDRGSQGWSTSWAALTGEPPGVGTVVVVVEG